LEWKTHGAAGDFFDVAALLDHGKQDIVALVEERDFVTDFFELECNGLGIGHGWHGVWFSFGKSLGIENCAD
jgi:hypothetical protein